MGFEKLASELSSDLLNLHLKTRQFTKELTQQNDQEILRLLDLLEYVQRKWVDEIEKNTSLQDRVRKLETEVNTMRNEQLSSAEHLRHARAQIATLISEKDTLKTENDTMRRDFKLVKDILKPEISNLSAQDRKRIAILDFFTTAPSSSNDLSVAVVAPIQKIEKCADEEADFDKAEESIEQQRVSLGQIADSQLNSSRVYKRSHYETSDENIRESESCSKEVPAKRTKDSKVTVMSLDPGCSYHVEHEQKALSRRSINRSFSETELFVGERHEITTTSAANQLPKQTTSSSTNDVRSETQISSVCQWGCGFSIETRPHTYSNYTSLIGDKCDICNRWIGLGSKPAFKCNDCSLHLHKACVNRAPIPCVPCVSIPRTFGKQRPRLIDLCPPSRPLIPKLIIHCVLALESYYLSSDGLYRIPGQESQVIKLFNEFKNVRFQPKLRFYDPETITGCIKRFLAQLRDSLIPSSSWDEFVSAAGQHSKAAIDRCINDLPAPHKDTLAFLCSHFQKVCARSSINKVTPEVLAKSIAPTIVGRSPMRALSVAQGNDEAAKQTQVMLSLLDMPRNYWPKFYCYENEPLRTRKLQALEKQSLPTQKSLRNTVSRSEAAQSAADQSLLGPIHTPPPGTKVKFSYNKRNICLSSY
uniref:Rac GTPase-activating protein 1 n=1 Tax=Syphacia muris TaxID=451379 RepID=A0A0N5AZ73_9BILA